jgi:hypothetical protein
LYLPPGFSVFSRRPAHTPEEFRRFVFVRASTLIGFSFVAPIRRFRPVLALSPPRLQER